METQIFCSFLLDKTEIAIDVECVQEVVNFPENIFQMPLSPEFLVGLFQLRKKIIPIINVKNLLKMENNESYNEQKIAIISYEQVRVGLLFDSTGEILRIHENEKNDFHYSQESNHAVILGALKINNSDRLLQILDPLAIIKIENLPQIYDKNNDNIQLDKNLTFLKVNKCITFSVSNLKLAFEMNSIYEIVQVPEIQHSPLQSDLCMGLFTLRGQVIPVVNFSGLLHCEKDFSINGDSRIIILHLNDCYLGLLVKSVESIDKYSEDSIMPIPIFSKDRVKMFIGCIHYPHLGDVFLLNYLEIFSNEEIHLITQGHSKLFDNNKISHQFNSITSSDKQVYILFKLKFLFGIPIKEIKEIIEYSSSIIKAPGLPKFVDGILNLRGKLVVVIDTRVYYNLEEEKNANLDIRKILLFLKDEELFGLIVDSVESIISITENNKLKLPKMFSDEQNKNLELDIKEVIGYKTNNKSDASFIVLNINHIFQNLKSKQDA